MSNASLKDQLKAVASQLSSTHGNDKKSSQQKHKPKPSGAHQHANHKQQKPAKVKPAWLDYVQYGVELLRAYFPSAFRTMNEVRPLKKGIKQDLVKRLSTIENITIEDKACMVKSLSYYVNTAAYHKSVIVGAIRIDLDGNEAGTVTAEEAKYSIERQQAKQLAKQQAAQMTNKNIEAPQSKEEEVSVP